MYNAQHPWIAEREATLCTWKFDRNRGYVSNPETSLINDFMCLSDRQLYDYARMIKECGFTGIQVMDICAAWRASGSWENVHDRFKVLAAACHSIGLRFTVWCWAAEFSGHGWTEPEAAYRNVDPSLPAYKDPKVLSVFEKYYDIYADLAPFADRVIAHFFDPGNLTDMPSIIFFVKLLAKKFKEKNPSVKIAVDTWGCPEGYPEALVQAGLDDVMLMELPFLPIWEEPGKRANFRRGVKELGCGLGVWGWYTADMEIDQLASMTVNCRVLKDVFNRVRVQGDGVMVPEYWSETDSYHLLNFFSLYAAGHLLIDPEADPDELLRDSARAVAGGGNDGSCPDAEALLYVLEVIRDARSGGSWESYWWSSPGYVLKTGNYEDILKRIDRAISLLTGLSGRPEPEDGIRFPITRRQLYKLMLPHLFQIKQFAEFRRDLRELELLKESGADRETLQRKADLVSWEIPEYNCVTGLWGQPEAREAFDQLTAFCRKNGLALPERSPAARFRFKRWIIDRLTVCQRGLDTVYAAAPSFYEGGMPDAGLIASLMEELASEGVLRKDEQGQYYLSDWRDHRFDLSS